MTIKIFNTNGLFAFTLLIVSLIFTFTYKFQPTESAMEHRGQKVSAQRILDHLKVIASAPHPIGSEEHARVLTYLKHCVEELAWEFDVQESEVIFSDGKSHRVGRITNLLARLPGTNSEGAVLFSGHYDSVPNSPGAGDDGVAIASFLEAMRLLKQKGPLKNDLIFLFADAEEQSQLGARAFIEEHPWAKEVKLVFNLEGRGNAGALHMFETTHGNRWLVEQYAKAVSHPFATSLAYEIYKHMPNTTDFTLLKTLPVQGLNFAAIDGIHAYHTSLDQADRLDPKTLRHVGLTVVELANHFGTLEFQEERAENGIYFTVPFLGLVMYPSALGWPLFALACLLFLGAVALLVTCRKLKLSGLFLGAFIFLFGLISIPYSCTLVWQFIESMHPEYASHVFGHPYLSRYYLYGFLALTTTLVLSLSEWLARKAAIEYLGAGALAWWLLLAGTFQLYVPSAGYLFCIPLICVLFGLNLVLLKPQMRSGSKSLTLSLFCLPAFPIFLGFIPNLFLALPVDLIALPSLLAVLFTGLFLIQVNWMIHQRGWIPLTAVGALSIALLITPSLQPKPFTASRPQLNSLFFIRDANRHQNLWVSRDTHPDSWTSRYFKGKTEFGRIDHLLPDAHHDFLTGRAPMIELPAPNLVVKSDELLDGQRTLSLHIAAASKNASTLKIHVETEAELVETRLGARTLGDYARSIHYFNPPPAGLDLTLRLLSDEPLSIRVIEQTYGLPDQVGFSERPNHTIPTNKSIWYEKTTLVTKRFRLGRAESSPPGP